MSDLATRSCWYEPDQTLLPLKQAALDRDLETEVVVVGGGIAGLSVAYHLTLQGKSVIVLEDGDLGSGMTGRTSAHLSFALDDGYAYIESCHGREGARRAAESHAAAVSAIEESVARESIECQFLRVDGFLFNPPGLPDQKNLQEELEAAQRAGVEVDWVERAPSETSIRDAACVSATRASFTRCATWPDWRAACASAACVSSPRHA